MGERPGISKRSSAERVETPTERKARFERLLASKGLGGHRQGQETADALEVARTTLTGWRNPRALDRVPTDEAFELLEALPDAAAVTETVATVAGGRRG